MTRGTTATTGACAVLLIVLTACSSGSGTPTASRTSGPSAVVSEMPADTASMPPGDKKSSAPTTVPGSFIGYGEYQSDVEKYATGDVVLFFNATWCPTCQDATRNLESASIPEGLTVVSVDYDDSTELKQKYGVTTQHTFVQIAPDGRELTKFTGSTSVDEIDSRLV